MICYDCDYVIVDVECLSDWFVGVVLYGFVDDCGVVVDCCDCVFFVDDCVGDVVGGGCVV